RMATHPGQPTPSLPRASMPRTSYFSAIVLSLAMITVVTAGDAPGPSADFFEAKVRPLLVESCLKCHGDKKQSSGLRLDSRAALLEGGENGPAIVPGDPEKSLLVQAVRYTHEDIRLPPKGKLPRPSIDAARRRGDQGG